MGEILDQVQYLFSFLPGGVPSIVGTVFLFIFGAIAAKGLYRMLVPKTPTMPKPPKAPAALSLAPQAPTAGDAAATDAAKSELGPGDSASDKVAADDDKPKKGLTAFWPFQRNKPKAKIRRLSTAHLDRSFQQQMEQIETHHASSKQPLYAVPWFLMIGESGCGKSTALDNVDLPRPFGVPPSYDDPNHPKGCDWWFYNEGIVLDVAGDSILYADPDTETYVSDNRGWKHLLKLLQRKREKRPIDGVVLCIPAQDLLDPERPLPAILQEKAEHLYGKLWLAQKILGMRLPIYVLVTQCDVISGFQDFCQVLPERLQQDIFGWSNTHSLETGYNQTLLEEAFRKVYRDLNEIQLELVTAAKEQISDRDSFLLFPHEMRPVFQQLRVYLERIFKPSVFHEPFYFRGLYFTGDSGNSLDFLANNTLAATGDTSEALKFKADTQHISQPRPTPIFLTQLFAQKIFQESGLARPVKKIYHNRNTLLWATRGAIATVAVAGIASQWWAFQEVEREINSIEPVLDQIIADTAELRIVQGNLRWDDGAFTEIQRVYRTSATHLLDGMAGMNGDGVESLLIPSAWFSDVDEQIQNALARGYKQFILEWLYIGLHKKSRSIIFNRLTDLPNYVELNTGENVHQVSDFINLKYYVMHLYELQKNIDLYNKLQTYDAHVKTVGDLVDYIYNISLPASFYSQAESYSSAVQRATYRDFPIKWLKNPAQKRYTALRELLFFRLFQDNTLKHKIADLTGDFNALENSTKHTQWFSILQNLNQTIASIEEYATHEEFSWVIRPHLDLGNDYSALMGHIRKIRLLGEEVYKETQERAVSGLKLLRSELQNYRSDLTGALMQPRSAPVSEESKAIIKATQGDAKQHIVDAKLQAALDVASKPLDHDQHLVLSPAVLGVRTILDDYLKRDFMSHPNQNKNFLARIPENKTLYWNANKLTEAVDLVNSFQKFLTEELQHFPSLLQNIAKTAGYYQLHLNVLAKMAEAQSVDLKIRAMGADFERGVRKNIENFAAAREAIDWLLEAFNVLKTAKIYQEKFANTSNDLERLVITQAHRQLGGVDALLLEDDLYRPKMTAVFEDWDKSKRPNLQAFGVSDKEELRYFLDVQRDRVHYLTQNYAQPLLQFLLVSGRQSLPALGNNAVFTRWRQIYQEMFKYDSEKPENSITELDQYILHDLDIVTIDNCYSELSPSADPEIDNTSDYFKQKKIQLRDALFTSCNTVKKILEAEILQTPQAQKLPLQTKLPLGQGLTWDVEHLKTALNKAESFSKFIQEELPKLSPEQQAEAIDVGFSQFHLDIIDAIARSQKIEPSLLKAGSIDLEERLRDKINNFAEAAPIIDWLIQFFTQIEAIDSPQHDLFTNSKQQLIDLGLTQATRLLDQTDRLLDNETLYQPRRAKFFTDWLNDKPLALDVFGVADREALKYYLQVQRDRLLYMANNYAQPLLRFIGDKKPSSGASYNAAVPRWSKIYQSLSSYNAEKPNSSLLLLEDYVLNQLDEINAATCYRSLYDQDLDAESGDFFLQKRALLQTMLFQQCRLNQKFIADDDPSFTGINLKTTIPTGKGIFWDAGLLRHAVNSAESFSQFLEKDIVAMPKSEQDTIRNRSLGEFHTHILSLIAEAEYIAPHQWTDGALSFEEGLRSEVQNFSDATEVLNWLVNFMGLMAEIDSSHQDKFKQSQNQVTQLGIQQSRNLLSQVNKLLDADDLYQPQNGRFFAEWDNPRPLSFEVFGVDDVAGLKYYLKIQRERIHNLAQNFARPLLSFLGGKTVQDAGGAQGIIPRWIGIYQTLSQYDNQKPDNGLGNLENYVLNELDTIETASCYRKLYDRDLDAESGNYFLQKRALLQRLLFEQCRVQQRYIAADDPNYPDIRLPQRLARNQGLLWDATLLRHAISSAEAFGQFISKDIITLPKARQDTARELGYAEFHTHLLTMMSSAIKVETHPWLVQRGLDFETGLDIEQKNFSETEPLINWLLTLMTDISKADGAKQSLYNNSRVTLERILILNSHRLLAYTSQLLHDSALYEPAIRRFFLEWDAEKPLSSVAFKVADEAEMDYYLGIQRDRVSFLVQNYATPIVTFLRSKNLPAQLGSSPAMPLWSRLKQEMFKYDNEDPNNSLALLEEFIREGLDKINLGNCYTELAATSHLSTGDFFLNKRATIQRSLFYQCQYLADLEAYRRYYVLQDFFNQNLANRFPFAQVSYATFFSEAEPETIQDFFAIYATYGAGLKGFIENSYSFDRDSRQQVTQFLDQMDAVKTFFNPMLEQKLPLNKPLYNMVVDFRVNQLRELGGNQIIDWQLEKTSKAVETFLDGQALSTAKPNLQAEREGSWHFSDRWHFGEALRFSFRWARNSAYRPYWDGVAQGFDLEGDDDTAVFNFRSRWALLEAIRKQQGAAEDFARLEDSEPHTLKFEIATRRLLGAIRIPQRQRLPDIKPLPELPEECYQDWYEDEYGDARCLEQNYKRIDTQKPPAQVMLEFGQKQQDTPYPSAVTEDNTLTEAKLQAYDAAFSDEFIDTQKARVFVRFTLTHPDQKERVIVPDFPRKAPQLLGFIEDYEAYRQQQEAQALLPKKQSPAALLQRQPVAKRLKPAAAPTKSPESDAGIAAPAPQP